MSPSLVVTSYSLSSYTNSLKAREYDAFSPQAEVVIIMMFL
jgi:hypothetical protein